MRSDATSDIISNKFYTNIERSGCYCMHGEQNKTWTSSKKGIKTIPTVVGPLFKQILIAETLPQLKKEEENTQHLNGRFLLHIILCVHTDVENSSRSISLIILYKILALNHTTI